MTDGDRPRILLVSNRLPATVQMEEQNVEVIPSAGGLATGLRALHERSGGLWFGWPGDVRGLRQEQRIDLDGQLRSLRLQPIHLSGAEVDRYYFGYSNGMLWPLFHYLLDRIPFDSSDWEAYLQVNRRFAETVAGHYQSGDLVWIHDYQLMMVPELLRERVPRARIGFFLHIPFPSSEIFRILPQRAEILRGILGADLIGFHTPTYMRHFSMSILRILGIEADIDRVWHEGRQVRFGAYPMGIDSEAFEAFARDPEVKAEARSIREESGGAKIILAVDRLDYTKGIPGRLIAFGKLLEREPALRGKVRLIQIAVPSRVEVLAYENFKRQVDELVGQINGRFGTARYVPIHYVNRGFSQRELAALYVAADVMAVTPLRDGLNLVAKEYIASKEEPDGVLVLSEFAGAAAVLSEALVVNPYDVDGLAGAFSQALRMGPEERASRLKPMKDRVRTYNVHHWAGAFLEDLSSYSGEEKRKALLPSPPAVLEGLLERIRRASRLVLFLDYDGTLSPFVAHPDLAVPDDDLLRLLEILADRPGTSVHLVSGRDRDSLRRWFGRLPVYLHAEHGLWSLPRGAEDWIQNLTANDSWKPKVRPILEGFIKSTPGSFMEEKTAGLVWHYRMADRVFGAVQAKELRLLLIELLSNAPVEVLAGNKVVEIRAQGFHKGNIVTGVLGAENGPVLALAIGDDESDEDMFKALPEGSIAIHAGPGETHAPYRLAGPGAVGRFLKSILPP